MEPAELEAMFRMVAIADYDERYVVPQRHGELAPRRSPSKALAGSTSRGGAVPPRRADRADDYDWRPSTAVPDATATSATESATRERSADGDAIDPLKLASLLLQYPTPGLRAALAASRHGRDAPRPRPGELSRHC